MQELFVYFVLFERLSLAFGNKIAKVDTTLLNRRATFRLGRLGLPARLPFSKPKVNWLLHRSPHKLKFAGTLVRSTPY